MIVYACHGNRHSLGISNIKLRKGAEKIAKKSYQGMGDIDENTEPMTLIFDPDLWPLVCCAYHGVFNA